MLDRLAEIHPVALALLAGLFTWAVTAAGAALAFFTRRLSPALLAGLLGFSAGVMLAASFWSLLAPAIAIAEDGPTPAWLVAGSGFLAGAAVLFALDKLLPHLHVGLDVREAEGPATAWRRSVLLVTAITLHNIPEGLAVGVAFGGTMHGLSSASLGAAVALAIGIAVQNLPEGVAVAMPLRGEGLPALKAFHFGQLSAAVEPLAALLGAAAVVVAAPILPYALAFAAGAMVFVVVEELIPEAVRTGHVDLATLCLIGGFAVMMFLDVALG
jgi:ZIP family zinc transporter